MLVFVSRYSASSSLVFCFYTSVFSSLLWGHCLNDCGSQLALFEYAHQNRVVFLNDIETGNDKTVYCPLEPFLLVNTPFQSYKDLSLTRCRGRLYNENGLSSQ